MSKRSQKLDHSTKAKSLTIEEMLNLADSLRFFGRVKLIDNKKIWIPPLPEP